MALRDAPAPTRKCQTQRKILRGKNTLAYCFHDSVKAKTSFIRLTPGPNVIKNLWLYFTDFLNKLECFFPGKHFQPSLMFMGNARNLPKCGIPEGCFTWIGCIFTNEHQIRLESTAGDKLYSLIQKFLNYGRKMYHKLGTRCRCYKTFYGRKLRLFIICQSVCLWPPQSYVCG